MSRTKTPEKRKKGMLKGISFDEVSFVGKGANQGAQVSIIKMDDPQEVSKRMFSEILAERLEGEEHRAFARLLYTENSALQDAVDSILYSETEDKKQAIFTSLQQFVQTFTSTVNDTDVIKSCEDLQKALSENENSDQEVNTVEKGIEFYKTLAMMNDEQKEIFKGLSEEEQAEVVKAASKDKEALAAKFKEMADKEMTDKKKGKMKKSVDNDEIFKTEDGTEITKSVVGEAAFLMLKGMNERLEKSEAATAKAQEIAKEERDKRILKEASDEATIRWPNLPGTALEKGKTLMAIRQLPEDVQKTQLEMLDSGNASNSKLFKVYGGDGTEDGNASEKLKKMADEHAKVTGLAFHKAYDAILDTPEGQKLYEETLK